MHRTSTTAVEEILLQANLAEYQNGIERVCSLQRGGKLTAEECVGCIEDLTRRLLRSRETLIIDP